MIDFPASPTDGQIFSAANGVVYKYSATYTSWLAQNPAPQVGGTGDFATAGAPALTTTPQAMIMPVVNGNSGSWFNPANGRWTPPAGRYHLYGALGAWTNTGNITSTVSLRKNGVIILTSNDASFTSAWGFCSVEANVDANGTDYFDLWGSVNTAATGSQGYFGAFPLTGITGAPGAPGASGSLVTNPLWQQVSETILSSSLGNALDVTVPVGAKQFQIDFDLTITGGASDYLMLLAMQGASPYITADQYAQQMYGAGAGAGAQVLGPQAYMPIGYCVYGQGRITGSLAAATVTTFRATAIVSEFQSPGRVIRSSEVDCGALRSSITGFRLRSNMNNLAAGSTARVSVLQ